MYKKFFGLRASKGVYDTKCLYFNVFIYLLIELLVKLVLRVS